MPVWWTGRSTRRARSTPRWRWPANADTSVPDLVAIRLADSDLWVAPEADDATGPDEIIAGWGNTMRDGLGVRAERGGVEIALTGGVLIDPVLGVRRTSIGIAGGRVVAIGRAGNPDTMDGVEVVLDTGTAVFDARGLLITPGGIDSHVHLLSPQVCDAALASGLTTLVTQDWGPVWNLGANPPEAMEAVWASFDAIPLNLAMLVRGSSARPEPVERSLLSGGAGLKIHEDVSAGPEQIRCALDICDRYDVQLAIHTDGLNEALSVEDTLAAFGGSTVHAYHIEGVGGGHAPDLLELAGRDRVLTSSTTPTLPFGPNAEAEHLAMVAAVHVLDPSRTPGDAAILRLRVREWTMRAESVLHDLGVIHMISSDSQGMGRVGEVLRRAFQTADAMKRQLGGEPGDADNERVLRYLAKVTINPAVAHGLAAEVGSLQPGRLADAVLWSPEQFAVRPELVLKAGIPAYGTSGDGNASTMLAQPLTVGPQFAALGGAPARTSLAFMAQASLDAELPTGRPRAAVSGCRDLTAAAMVRNTRTGAVVVDAARQEVRLDGEPVRAEPVERLAFSASYLLG
jgi:urease subunit alpha